MHDNRLVALDFDGVICDSAGETAVTAWKAGRHIWPEWQQPEPPQTLVERFRRLRPVLETGREAVPLLRVAYREIAEDAVFVNPRSYIDQVCREAEIGADRLHHLFATTRDNWIETDFEDWLARHRFYKGTVPAVRQALERHPTYILTTKQTRFAEALLQAQGVTFPPENIYGLETGQSKEETLTQLLRKHDPGIFVEDRPETLDRAAACPDLENLHLYLAAWGYNTEEMRTRAKQTGRIHILQLEEFHDLIG